MALVSGGLKQVPAVTGNVAIVGALTCCVLLHSLCDLKPGQRNVQQGLIWDLLRYEFEQGHNPTEETKNICRAKREGAVDYMTVLYTHEHYTYTYACRIITTTQ